MGELNINLEIWNVAYRITSNLTDTSNYPDTIVLPLITPYSQ